LFISILLFECCLCGAEGQQQEGGAGHRLIIDWFEIGDRNREKRFFVITRDGDMLNPQNSRII